MDRTVKIWDLARRSEVVSLTAPDEVFVLALDREGGRLATLRGAVITNVSSFTGDVATLREVAASRLGTEVVNGILRARAINPVV